MKHKALIAAMVLGLASAPTAAMATSSSSSNFNPSSIFSALSGLGNAGFGNANFGNINLGNISWGNISWGNGPGGWDPDDGKSDGC